MRLASYLVRSEPHFGIVAGDGLIDLTTRWPGVAMLAGAIGDEQLDRARDLRAGAPPDFACEEVKFLPPIPRPGKTVCVGINYRTRPGEYGDREEPRYPSLFLRASAAQVGHLAELILPLESTQFDFEGEVALVIGKQGRRIPEDVALDYVAGYSCFNDGSVRDWMRHGVYNVTAGKNFDASGSFGPWLVTRDEIAEPGRLRISTRVNGKTVQDDSTSNLIFSFSKLIAYISTFATLEPGDVIATGTPTGSGGKRVPPVWLGDGDVLEVEVAGVGVLRTPVRAEAKP